jgi:hypothetical protein
LLIEPSSNEKPPTIFPPFSRQKFGVKRGMEAVLIGVAGFHHTKGFLVRSMS